MKKTILLLLFVFATLAVVSCKSETKTDVNTDEQVMTYSCPMDCENGKTYTEKGTCPVCKMELTLADDAQDLDEAVLDHDNHDGHNH